MTAFTRRAFLASTVALTACSQEFRLVGTAPEKFVCPPCGCSEDGVEFDAPGRCPDCDMTLVPTHESNMGFQPQQLPPGAGSFEIAGGRGREDSRIKVHYYLPDVFLPESKILLIVPGAGRNSFQYRNEWLAAARQNNILVAALGYPEEQYDFAAYHMGGVVKNLTFRNLNSQSSGVISIDDADIEFDLNPNKEEWLFQDFDRVFAFLKKITGLTSTQYDIFGHSAGGQILHRMALFSPDSLANNIIAANAGFYTLPNLNEPLPIGLRGSGVAKASLSESFLAKLTLLLGEQDDGDDAGGTILHTPTIDQQGLGRLSRGKHFYQVSRERAKALGINLQWQLQIIPNVGHDFREMTQAASKLLQP